MLADVLNDNKSFETNLEVSTSTSTSTEVKPIPFEVDRDNSITLEVSHINTEDLKIEIYKQLSNQIITMLTSTVLHEYIEEKLRAEMGSFVLSKLMETAIVYSVRCAINCFF